MIPGKITLIGGGPSNVELITIRAIEKLKKAHVILYDSLVDERTLEFAPNAEKIFVGKRKGCVAYTQQEINQMLVNFAKEGKNTVRLKGGDVFVFGRGFEELEFAKNQQIEVEVVPGVSSAFSVPLLYEIFPTEKTKHQGVWVITATTKSHDLSKDLLDAVNYQGTVIIFMGITKIKEIIQLYLSNQQQHKTIYVIENGYRQNQQLTFGKIESFENQIPEKGFESPGLIIIK
ncbi:MAG: uroporphyrinogen-III C-methyltransferase [Cytophagales bacterium]